jgi:hypothetical protein
MHIVIAGAGRVGAALAQKFAADGNDVVVIDHDEEALAALGRGIQRHHRVGRSIRRRTRSAAPEPPRRRVPGRHDSDNANLVAVEVVKATFGVDRSHRPSVRSGSRGRLHRARHRVRGRNHADRQCGVSGHRRRRVPAPSVLRDGQRRRDGRIRRQPGGGGPDGGPLRGQGSPRVAAVKRGREVFIPAPGSSSKKETSSWLRPAKGFEGGSTSSSRTTREGDHRRRRQARGGARQPPAREGAAVIVIEQNEERARRLSEMRRGAHPHRRRHRHAAIPEHRPPHRQTFSWR